MPPAKYVRETPADLVEYTVPAGHVYCLKTGKHVGPGGTAWVTEFWLEANGQKAGDGEANGQKAGPLSDVPEYDYSTGKAKKTPRRPKVRKE